MAKIMYTLSSREKQDYDDYKNNENNNIEDAMEKKATIGMLCAHTYRTASATVALTCGERGRKTKGFFIPDHLTDRHMGRGSLPRQIMRFQNHSKLPYLIKREGAQKRLPSFLNKGAL